jgi:RimJ/RimL family protein N-acetyltransferase
LPERATVTLRDVRNPDLSVFFDQQLEFDANSVLNSQTEKFNVYLKHWHLVRKSPANVVKTILADRRVAGYTLLWTRGDKRFVGFWLGQEFGRQGIATAATSLFLKEIKLRPIYANVAKQNLASFRVLRSAGFVIEADGCFKNVFGEVKEEFLMRLGTDAA